MEKKRGIGLWVVLIGLLQVGFWLLPTEVSARPATSDLHTLHQPDGSTFRARQWGDEHYSGHETEDGYSIVFDDQLKAWNYATHDSKGNLTSSGLVVGKADLPSDYPKHLRPVKEARSLLRQKRSLSPDKREIAAKTTGTNSILILPVNFKDTQPRYTRQDFEDLLFKKGSSSLRDYFEEVSYGKLTVSSGPSGIQDWYQASQNRDYYGAPSGSDPDSKDNDENIQSLVTEAVTALDNKGFDFKPYDNNDDCYVDTMAVLYQGFEEASSDNVNDIWPMQSDLSTEFTTKTACPQGGFIKIKRFTVQGELEWAEGVPASEAKIARIGTFAHEYGHALGLPDLYDTDYSSDGAGPWSLMAGGTDMEVPGSPGAYRPVHLDAWSKFALGWITPTQVFGALANEIILPVESFEGNPGGKVYQLLSGTAKSGEYFLVENRQNIGFDTALPGSGLLIWHIDGNAVSALSDENKVNNNECYPGSPTPCSESHYGVTLVQADGLWQLEKTKGEAKEGEESKSGDGGDPYPGTANNASFEDTTVPDSKLWNGTSSNVSITGITSSGTNITATLNAPGTLSASCRLGGAAAGPTVTGSIRSDQCRVFTLLLNQQPPTSMNGKLYFSLRVLSIPDLAGYAWFRPSNDKTPPYISVVKTKEGYLANAADLSYLEGSLSGEDLRFEIGASGLEGQTLVFETLYTEEGAEFNEGNLKSIQKVEVGFQ